MRPYHDDPDEFDFSDSIAVSRIRREQQREERRSMNRRYHGRSRSSRYADIEDYYRDGYDGFEGRIEDDYGDRHGAGRKH